MYDDKFRYRPAIENLAVKQGGLMGGVPTLVVGAQHATDPEQVETTRETGGVYVFSLNKPAP